MLAFCTQTSHIHLPLSVCELDGSGIRSVAGHLEDVYPAFTEFAESGIGGFWQVHMPLQLPPDLQHTQRYQSQ